ncbi:hypothetical protein VULLAG_LOCUS10648 [Vulpes lagopus]
MWSRCSETEQNTLACPDGELPKEGMHSLLISRPAFYPAKAQLGPWTAVRTQCHHEGRPGRACLHSSLLGLPGLARSCKGCRRARPSLGSHSCAFFKDIKVTNGLFSRHFRI